MPPPVTLTSTSAVSKEKAHIRLERGSGMSKVGMNERQENLIDYNSTHALDLYGLALLAFIPTDATPLTGWIGQDFFGLVKPPVC